MSAHLVAILRYWLTAPNIAWRIAASRRATLIPPQIKDYGLGIPACLANLIRILVPSYLSWDRQEIGSSDLLAQLGQWLTQ